MTHTLALMDNSVTLNINVYHLVSFNWNATDPKNAVVSSLANVQACLPLLVKTCSGLLADNQGVYSGSVMSRSVLGTVAGRPTGSLGRAPGTSAKTQNMLRM